jgi:Sulfotransferase family
MSASETLADWLSRAPTRLHRALPFEPRADLRRRLGRIRPWEEGYDFTAPPDRGHAVGPPDFVGVGGSLCGTRWWFDLVRSHPGVAGGRGRPIGLHYFSHYCLRPFGADDVARYHAWFPRDPGTLAGEWTPSYAAQLWVAPLLAAAAPDARLLFLVRDPVERFRLGLAETVESRVSNVGAGVADVTDRGFYAVQLRRLRQFFPAEHILVLQLERCVADVNGQLAATYRFLELDDGYRPARRVAPAPPDVPAIDATVVDRLSEVYAGDARDLAALVPDLDPELWPTLRARPSRRSPSGR